MNVLIGNIYTNSQLAQDWILWRRFNPLGEDVPDQETYDALTIDERIAACVKAFGPEDSMTVL